MRLHADTVVVGAGSAGAVIAARMTERSDREVLLVEAGPDYPDIDRLPDDLRDGTRNSTVRHDWGYHHRPTSVAAAIYFPRGRVVGGSSAVNTCIALRGQPYDYDEWGEVGLPDWSFEQCLPAFLRLENDLDVVSRWHGQEGPIPIRRHPPDELTTFQTAFFEACRELGFPECPDHNDPTTSGFGPHAMNKVGGVRMSAARCYLTPEVRARANLRVLPDTIIRRILFEGSRVRGIEVETRGETRVIDAGRVVLCAGAINTPGVLLRSGVGPRREVESIGVELVHDLPAVGARLWDHPGSGLVLLPRPGTPLGDGRDPIIQSTLRFTPPGDRYPNQMQLQPVNFFQWKELRIPLVAITAQLGKPRCHGALRVTSADPRAKPRIDQGFLADRDDLRLLADALQTAHLLVTDPVLASLAQTLYPNESLLSDRRELMEWLPSNCGSGYHPCGTVPMGPDGDPSAALDGRGRVRGVEGLVVADASIMPTCPSPNTNLTTLMIGERFGEWLRDGLI